MKKICAGLILIFILGFGTMSVLAEEEKTITNVICDENFDAYSGTISALDSLSLTVKGGFCEARDVGDVEGNMALFMGATATSTDGTRRLRVNVPNVSEGTLIYEYKLYLTDIFGTSGRFYIGGIDKNGTSVYHSYSFANGKLGTIPISTGEWHTLRYEIDVEHSSVDIYLGEQRMVQGQELQRSGVLIKEITYFQLSPSFSADQPGFFGCDDVKVTLITKQGRIVSVGDDEVVDAGADRVQFEMTHVPSGITKDNVVIFSQYGAVEIAELEIADNTVTAILGGALTSAADYTITILPAAFGTSDDIEPVTADFKTTPAAFDMGEPTVTYVENKIFITANFYNSTGEERPVALIAVMCRDDKFFGIKAVSDIIGEEKKISITDIEFSEKDSVKIFAINGWKGKVPLFGKVKNVSFEEIQH